MVLVFVSCLYTVVESSLTTTEWQGRGTEWTFTKYYFFNSFNCYGHSWITISSFLSNPSVYINCSPFCPTRHMCPVWFSTDASCFSLEICSHTMLYLIQKDMIYPDHSCVSTQTSPGDHTSVTRLNLLSCLSSNRRDEHSLYCTQFTITTQSHSWRYIPSVFRGWSNHNCFIVSSQLEV